MQIFFGFQQFSFWVLIKSIQESIIIQIHSIMMSKIIIDLLTQLAI